MHFYPAILTGGEGSSRLGQTIVSKILRRFKVQLGRYPGEDDIVRFENVCNRVN